MYKPRSLSQMVELELMPLAPAVLWSKSGEYCPVAEDNVSDVVTFINVHTVAIGIFRVHKVVDGLVRAYAFAVSDDFIWFQKEDINDGAQVASSHPRYSATDVFADNVGYLGVHIVVSSPKSVFKTAVISADERNIIVMLHQQDRNIRQFPPPLFLYTAIRECSIHGGDVTIRKFKQELPHEIYHARTENGILVWQDEVVTFDAHNKSMQQMIDAGYAVDQVNQVSEAFEPKMPLGVFNVEV